MKYIYPLAAAILFLSSAYGQQTKLSSDLAHTTAQSSLQVIVQHKHAPVAADHRRMEMHGARLVNELAGSNAALYEIAPESLAALAAFCASDLTPCDHGDTGRG